MVKSEHNHKGFAMKHKVTVILCALVIFLAGMATVSSYQSYQQWRAEQNAKATAVSQAEAHKNAVQQATFNAGVKKLEDQCAKDKAAYDALPSAQKSKQTAPQCDLNLVQ